MGSMKTHDWLDRERPRLARRAFEFCEKQDIKDALTRLDPSALRTVLGAAQQASCVEELKIMLRYQQGRDRGKWPEALVSGVCREVDDAAKAALGADRLLDSEDKDHANARLGATWLGFVVRLHKYVYETNREQQGGNQGHRSADQQRGNPQQQRNDPRGRR